MVPKNRKSLFIWLEESWHQVLHPEYVRKTCAAAWDRLRRIVQAQGGNIERIWAAHNMEEEKVDENSNVIQ